MQRCRSFAPFPALIAFTVLAAFGVARANPDEATYDKAYALLRAGKYAAAIPLFEKYIATVPRSDHYDLQAAHLNAGECYYQTDGYEGAARHLDAAIALVPFVRADKGEEAARLLPIVYYDAAYAHLALEQFRPAITDVTQGFDLSRRIGIRITADEALAYRVRGTAYLRVGAYSTALSDLNASLKAEPNSFLAHLSRGEALRALGNYAGSLSDFVAANKADGNSGYPYCEAGLTLILQRRDATARSAFDRCFQIEPSLRAQYLTRIRNTLANRH